MKRALAVPAIRGGAVLALVVALAAAAAPPARAEGQARPDWVSRSDANARVLLEVLARFSPEQASFLGVEGQDDRVMDLGPRVHERQQEGIEQALGILEGRLAEEEDALVRQDLEILIRAARTNLEGSALSRKHELGYFDAVEGIFRGLRPLLDDQVAPARRRAAVVRLRRYAGLEKGYAPILELARDRVRERLAEPGLLGPPKAELERSLASSALYVEGIGKLFAQFQLQGWQEAHARLETQVAEWDGFLRQEVLPRARTDFRLPAELYAQQLRQYGVEMAPEALADRARVAFMEIRNEMKAVAPLVAKEKGLAATDYRDVIRELKKQQIVGEAILPHYQRRLADLEAIVRREGIVTLPERAAQIRLASEAESAAIPAPHMQPPRLLGNRGEQGAFVLPLNVPLGPGAAAGAMMRFDDFTFDAASWTLTVHEARPGHEMQFASIIEKGVSAARAVFAFNSVNVEGWALYTEAELKPYLPLDGQLVSLQHRLMRAARAFLDPELQLGRLQPEDVVRFLMDEVVLSEAMARQEVERYTFRAPGQATSYFYGYTRWMQLKSQVELALGRDFDRRRYHDFLLAQGLLPPDVLAKAVLEEFLPAERARILEAEKAAMRAADSGMSAATLARDVERFVSFLADDVAFLAGGEPAMATGKEGVQKLWSNLFQTDGPRLTWAPTAAEVAASRDLGYTLGRWTYLGKNAQDQPVTRNGEYVTVWKKQADGSWKVLFDGSHTPVGRDLATRTLREASSRAGDLAVTVGEFDLESPGAAAPSSRDEASGKPTGRRLTIRRKDAAGAWTVAVDVANPVPPSGT